jgi:hypothetical protein
MTTAAAKYEKYFRSIDTAEHRDQIRLLVDRGYPVIRKTDYQIKIRAVNYYLGRGTITIDPCEKYADRGFEALLRLLNEKYPVELKLG